jgi:hypothetical protein
VCLHDATVLGEWQGRTRLHLLVRPEGGGDRLVLLTYTLAEPPRVTVAALPAELRSPQPVWMYDEVGVERQSPRGRASKGPVFTHSILLRDGRELSLRFRRFQMARPEALPSSVVEEAALSEPA